MIAPLTRGKNVYGLVNYHERKVANGEARLLYQQGFIASDPKLYKALLHQRIAQSRIPDPTFHVSLNFPHAEVPEASRMEAIAREYMQGMGFGAQPYLVYQHMDRQHTHVHIISVRVDEKGKKISDYFDWKRSAELCQAIEKKYLLQQVNHISGEGVLRSPSESVDLDGKMGVRSRIAKALKTVKERYKPASFSEFKKLLSLEGLTVEEAGVGALHPEGLLYGLRDEPEARKVKASSVYHTATRGALERLFEKNAKKKSAAVKTFLTEKIEWALSESAIRKTGEGREKGNLQKGKEDPLEGGIQKGKEGFLVGGLQEGEKGFVRERLPEGKGNAEEQAARSERGFALRMATRGVTVLYEKNASGTYGISFLDERSGFLYKGSELGAEYAYSKVKGRIGEQNGVSYPVAGRGDIAIPKEKHSAFYAGMQQGLWTSVSAPLSGASREVRMLEARERFLSSEAGKAFKKYNRLAYSEKMQALERVLEKAIPLLEFLDRMQGILESGEIPSVLPLFPLIEEKDRPSLYILKEAFKTEYREVFLKLVEAKSRAYQQQRDRDRALFSEALQKKKEWEAMLDYLRAGMELYEAGISGLQPTLPNRAHTWKMKRYNGY